MFMIFMASLLVLLLVAIGFLTWRRLSPVQSDPSGSEFTCQNISNAFLVFPGGDFSFLPKLDMEMWTRLGCKTYPDLPCQGLSNVFGAKPGDLAGLNSPEVPDRIRDSFVLRDCQTQPYDCQLISDTLGAGLVPKTPWFLAEWGHMEEVVWRIKQCSTKPGGLLGVTSDGSIVIKDVISSPWRMLTQSIADVRFAAVTRSFDGELMATTDEAGKNKRLFLNGKTTAAYGNFSQALPDGSAFRKVVAGPSLQVNFIQLGENGKVWFSSALFANFGDSKLGPADVDEGTPGPTAAPGQGPNAKFVSVTWGRLNGMPTIVAIENDGTIWTRPGDLSQQWAKTQKTIHRFVDIAYSFTDDVFVGLHKNGQLSYSSGLSTWTKSANPASQFQVVGLG